MLSAASRPYIDASVPVLREHGLAITTHFYREMFADRPELTQMFNMGNQANGSQQQSLASAVFAYAANIDNAAALGPVLERIVHKHAAVGLTPAHYPIVGRHLLGAISAVLGEAATPPLLAAWDEAYWLLAGELIAAEARLYQRTGVAAGELTPVRVVRREAQGDQVVALTLAAADGQPLRAFRPGQYISVEARLDDGQRQLRQYSLSAENGLPTWRVSVKREAGDRTTPAGAVSNWLHANAQEGTELKVSAPFGEFTPALDGRRPLVLLSAGIGITPMLSVLRTLAAQGSQRQVLFAHAARDGRHHADQLHVARAALRRAAEQRRDRAGLDRLGLGHARALRHRDGTHRAEGQHPVGGKRTQRDKQHQAGQARQPGRGGIEAKRRPEGQLHGIGTLDTHKAGNGA